MPAPPADSPTMTATDLTPDRTAPAVGDVLYETRSHERYAVVVATDPVGVTLRRNGSEQFVPHAMFGRWNDSSLRVEPALAEHHGTETTARRNERLDHGREFAPAAAVRCRHS